MNYNRMGTDEALMTLKSMGLSGKEARAYPALLSLGEATATKLAERSGITRTLIYEIADRLMEKGLVSSIVKEGTKHFSASEPDSLLREQEAKTERLREAMPDLKAIMAAGRKETRVEVFRGRKGLNSILRMIIDEGHGYDITGGGQEACHLFEHENRVFAKRAEKAGIKGRILVRKGDDFFIGKLEGFRYLRPKLLSLVSNMVWGSKTAIFVWSEPYYAIVVDDEKVAESNRSTFDYLWDIAEKPTKADVRKRTI
jgi:DNA-binding MarR family transcriptional regulator